jgi:hypothetical protein
MPILPRSGNKHTHVIALISHISHITPPPPTQPPLIKRGGRFSVAHFSSNTSLDQVIPFICLERPFLNPTSFHFIYLKTFLSKTFILLRSSYRHISVQQKWSNCVGRLTHSLITSLHPNHITMKFSSSFLSLLAFFTLFSCIFADSNSASSNIRVFSTVTSGTVVQTLVLKTTVITSCPCSTSPTATATGSHNVAIASPQIQTTSLGSSVRPRLLVVAGGIGVLSSLLLIFA